MTAREAAIHQARVYLTQARVARFESWRATLIRWAGDCRRRAMKPNDKPAQGELF